MRTIFTLRVLLIFCVVLGFAEKARPDATIIVTNFYKGTLLYQAGGDVTPYDNWVTGGATYSSTLDDLGVSLLRWFPMYGDNHGWIHRDSLYPYKGGWQWNAGAVSPGPSHGNNGIDAQLGAMHAHHLAALFTFSWEVNDTISYPDASINFDLAAYFCAGIIDHMVNVWSVPVPFFELGNELELGQITRAPTGKYNYGETLYGFSRLENPNLYDPLNTRYTNLEYYLMFEAMYPAIKAVSPTTKVAAWAFSNPLQGGTGGDGFHNWLYMKPNWHHPDYRAVHIYPNAGNGAGPQVNLDREYKYSGYEWNGAAFQSIQGSILSTYYGITNGDISLNEWNYDSGQNYSPMRDTMWGVDYSLLAIARMANSFSNYHSIVNGCYYEIFSQANTDQLADGMPPTALTKMGMGFRILKPILGLDKRILKINVTTADVIAAEGTPAVTFARLGCIAVRGNSFYGLMLVNSDVGALQNANITMRALTNNAYTVQIWSNVKACSNNVPSTVRNGNLVARNFTVSLPPYGVAIVKIPYAGLFVTNFKVSQTKITNSMNKVITFTVKAVVTGGIVTNVSLDLSSTAGTNFRHVKMTNISGATMFRYSYTVPAGLTPSEKSFLVAAKDNLNNINLGNVTYITDIQAPPQIMVTNISTTPYSITNYKPNVVTYQLTAKDFSGGTITNAVIDLSSLGGSPQVKMSNISGNTLWRYSFTVPTGFNYGTRTNHFKVYSSFFGSVNTNYFCTNRVMFYRQIPGTIHGIDYDFGGEGVGYHDPSPVNTGMYRADANDIFCCDGIFYGGDYMDSLTTGEWLQYSVNVLTTANYYLSVRMADLNPGPSFTMNIDGANVATVSCVSVGGNWTNLIHVASNISLMAGQHQMRITFNKLFNTRFNWVRFDYQGPLGIMYATASITNTTLNSVSIGSTKIPGSTISVRVYCTNSFSAPVTGPVVTMPISTNTVYVTNSSTVGVPAQWVPEWSTNKSPNMSFTSPNFISTSPPPRKVLWVRWKRTGGPMPMNTAVTFRYKETIK